MPYKGLKPGRFIRFENADRDMLDNMEDVDKAASRTYVFGNQTISYGTEFGAFDIFAITPEDRHDFIIGCFIPGYDDIGYSMTGTGEHPGIMNDNLFVSAVCSTADKDYIGGGSLYLFDFLLGELV